MNDLIALRRAVPDDLKALAALSSAVAWPHRAADLKLMLELGRGFVACDRNVDDIAGIGFWWPNGRDAATLGLVIVSPARQGRGIGGRLLTALLDDAHPRAVKLVATAAGQPLYEKLGFHVVGGIRQHQGVYAQAPKAVASVRPAGARDRDAVVALDVEAIGAERGTLVARLLSVGSAVLLTREGAPAGFAVRRAFGRGEVVGPIVAPDEDAAIALLRALAGPGFLRVDCPAEATRFAAHLTRAGLAVVDEAAVMLRGDWPATAGRVRSFALASQALC